MSDFEKAFYTIPEAAEILRLHENTIYKMVRRKEIEHYKVGKQIRIAAAELERLKVPAEKRNVQQKNADPLPVIIKGGGFEVTEVTPIIIKKP